MKIIAHVLAALALVATAAPLAQADEPCDRPVPTYVQPGPAPVYYPYAEARLPIVREPPVYRYGWHDRWEARRIAEARREAYRRWRWHERREHYRGYDRY